MRGYGLILAMILTTSAYGMFRPIVPDDIAKLKRVSEPEVDRTGTWVVYTVSTTDVEADKQGSHLWMTSWDGRHTIQLSSRQGESESTPHFSPDGRWLGFLSSRGDEQDDTHVWLMDRRGGEGEPLGGITGSVEDFVWSPDSRKLALVVLDPDPDAADKTGGAVKPAEAAPDTPTIDPPEKAPSAHGSPDGKPKPIVISRFQFKQDIDGYLRSRYSHIWVYDLASRTARRITTGNYDEALPAWSPDSLALAFTSHRSADPDRDYDSNLYLAEVSTTPREPRALTTYAGADNATRWSSYPSWSPDGQRIAYLQGGPVALFAYGVHTLAVVPRAGGSPQILTPTLDRNVSSPIWTADGKAIRFEMEDDGTLRVAEVPSAGGRVKIIAGGFRTVSAPTVGPGGGLAVLLSTSTAPAEVYALDRGGKLRQLSHQNDAWLSEVSVASAERTVLHSKDGTEVHGFLVTPPGLPARALPTILFNHGGPQMQFDAGFNVYWQVFAGHGYAVVSTNPRGSSGRGEAYAKALFADWGGPSVPDALSAVDDAVGRGVADPARLYVGGWSYGAMLTNYLIASDTRFKAAVSGAGTSNALAGYGTDQYIRDYEAELGTPWSDLPKWLKVSYPFLHNDRIVTPTLFMGGERDFNVPLLNTEQMYQALQSRHVPTELVIYPGQFHSLRRPSFVKDRMERWLAWYDHPHP